MTVRLDKDDREITLSLKQYDDLRLGYCKTVHKAQSVTSERCHVLLGGPLTDLHIGYVSSSRSRQGTQLVFDEASAGPGLRDAIKMLSRDRSKDLAHDVMDREARKRQEQTHELNHSYSMSPRL